MRAKLLALGVALLVGHGGQPLGSATGARDRTAPPRAGLATTAADAGRFLAAARGASPVICSLAAGPVGDGWGNGGAPLDQDAAEADLVEWAFQPSMTGEDLTVLEAGLRDGDLCVRAMAARLLGHAGRDGARILSAALGEASAATRRAAVEGLGYAKDPTTTPALIRRLEDSDPGVRASAAWALGRLEARDAAPALGEALADPVLTVRLAAIRALGELEVETSIELILPMLLAEEPVIRVAAARALGELH